LFAFWQRFREGGAPIGKLRTKVPNLDIFLLQAILVAASFDECTTAGHLEKPSDLAGGMEEVARLEPFS
jgi:hypothetical protein